MSYTYTSEQAKSVTIETAEQAKRVIIATAIVRCHTKESLMEDEQLDDLAYAFDLNLGDIEVGVSEDPNDFPFTYKFN